MSVDPDLAHSTLSRLSLIGDAHGWFSWIRRYAEIRYMDECIGKVLDKIEEMGLSDSTVIIFTADYGGSLGDHNYYFSQGKWPYDASSRFLC